MCIQAIPRASLSALYERWSHQACYPFVVGKLVCIVQVSTMGLMDAIQASVFDISSRSRNTINLKRLVVTMYTSLLVQSHDIAQRKLVMLYFS